MVACPYKAGGRFEVLVGTLIFILPFLAVAGLATFKIAAPWRYWYIVAREDGPVEWLTAVVYFSASLLAIWLSLRLKADDLKLHSCLAACFALGLLFIAMEEISWGQRLFGLKTPELLKQVNRQDEINLHNIGDTSVWLDGIYLGVTFYAMTARLWMPNLNRLLFRGRHTTLPMLLSPPRFLTPYFLVQFLLYCYYLASPLLSDAFGSQWRYGYSPDEGRFFLSRDQEASELILSGGFFLFAVWLLLLQWRGIFKDETLE